jgi:hypothetical protein
MKRLLLLLPLTLILSAQGGLTATCERTLSTGNCSASRVTFVATGLPGTLAHVLVKRGDGVVYDDFDYVVEGGSTSFTENTYPGGDFTVTLTDPTDGTFLAGASLTTGGE